jgi:hypothetical protein
VNGAAKAGSCDPSGDVMLTVIEKVPEKSPLGLGKLMVPRLMPRLPAASVDTGPDVTPVKLSPFAGAKDPDVVQLNGSKSALAVEAVNKLTASTNL